MLSERPLRMLCLVLLVLCVPFAGACRKKEQDQRKAFIEFLETEVLASTDADKIPMNEEIRKKIGDYSKHFNVITMYSNELNDINIWLAGEKMRIAANGPVTMDRLGSDQARVKQAVTAFSRSAQYVESIKAKAEAAKAALKQPEDVQNSFNRAYEKKVSGYAAASLALYAVQKDFYAEALRMGIFLEKYKDKIQFKNKTVIIEEYAILHEYNAVQKSLQEKAQKMEAALASGVAIPR